MPDINDFREKIKLEPLPVSKAIVWIWPFLLGHENDQVENALYGDLKTQFDFNKQKMGPVDFSLAKNKVMNDKLIEMCVAGWDVTQDGKELKPTIENIKKLPQDDLDKLLDEIDNRIETSIDKAKKKSSSKD